MANEGLLYVILVLGIISLLMTGYLAFTVPETPKVPTADEIASKVSVPKVDLSSIEGKIAEIEKEVNEDDNWKAQALKLATNDWTEKKYKAIFNFIKDEKGDIVDREDIEVVFIKKEKVTSFDAEDKDATVVQELKVKYETDTGEDAKVYITIITEIEDGEVTDQDIDLT